MSGVVYDGGGAVYGGGGGGNNGNGSTVLPPIGNFKDIQKKINDKTKLERWKSEHGMQADTHYAAHTYTKDGRVGKRTYDISDPMFHSSWTVKELLNSGVDLDNVKNPYNEKVDVQASRSAETGGAWYYDPRKQVDNPAYMEFQETVEKAKWQKKVNELTRIDEAQRGNDKEFNWEFAYLPPSPEGLDLSGFSHRNISIQSYAAFQINHDVNRWMAGGTLYDAPRAGNILFNPIGDLNTVRFLGVEDKNFSPNLNEVFANPEVFRVLGSFAGDKNFSVVK